MYQAVANSSKVKPEEKDPNAVKTTGSIPIVRHSNAESIRSLEKPRSFYSFLSPKERVELDADDSEHRKRIEVLCRAAIEYHYGSLIPCSCIENPSRCSPVQETSTKGRQYKKNQLRQSSHQCRSHRGH